MRYELVCCIVCLRETTSLCASMSPSPRRSVIRPRHRFQPSWFSYCVNARQTRATPARVRRQTLQAPRAFPCPGFYLSCFPDTYAHANLQLPGKHFAPRTLSSLFFPSPAIPFTPPKCSPCAAMTHSTSPTLLGPRKSDIYSWDGRYFAWSADVSALLRLPTRRCADPNSAIEFVTQASLSALICVQRTGGTHSRICASSLVILDMK